MEVSWIKIDTNLVGNRIRRPAGAQGFRMKLIRISLKIVSDMMQVMKDQFDDNVVISMRTNPRDPCVAHEVGVVLLRLVCLRVHQDLEADRRSSVAQQNQD